MSSGTAYFRKELPFQMTIQGSVNGQSFTIEGNGVGDSSKGYHKGKWVCTSGKLPMSWAALTSTLGYGYKCFANFPNGLTHFFQECMPEGYTQERVIKFENDGTLKTNHEVRYVKGVIMNNVTLVGEGFKEGSAILCNGIKSFLPTTERAFPHEDGLKCVVHHVFPRKGSDGGFVLATQTTVHRPLGGARNIPVVAPHFIRAEAKQGKDADDESDHIIQEETVEGYQRSTGTADFRKELPFQMTLQGSVNGKSFTVEGKGVGNSSKGYHKGKWVCTSGKLPMSWAALTSTLGYGYKCFANFPNGLANFYQECMPEGYTQERVIAFEDDGTLKTTHEVRYEKGVIMNNVTLLGEGFKEGSPILCNGIKSFLPTEERAYPHENGLRGVVHHVFPKKGGDAGFALATQITIHRPLGEGKNISVVAPHFIRAEAKQGKEADDNTDHVIQEETVEGYQLSMLEC